MASDILCEKKNLSFISSVKRKVSLKVKQEIKFKNHVCHMLMMPYYLHLNTDSVQFQLQNIFTYEPTVQYQEAADPVQKPRITKKIG